MKDILKAMIASATVIVRTMSCSLTIALACSTFINEAAAQTRLRASVEADPVSRELLDAPVVVKDRDGYAIDNRVKTADFGDFCANQEWPRKWTTEGQYIVLTCTIPNTEDMSGRRRNWPFSVYFRRDKGKFYELVKMTNPKGTQSRQDISKFITLLVEHHAERRGMGNPLYPGKER